MAADGYTRPAVFEDADFFAANLRQADRDEALALLGPVDVRDVLAQSVEASTRTWVRVEKERPVWIAGVAPAGHGVGVPWMVGTDEMFSHKGALMREARGYLEAMLGAYCALVNVVDARNERSVRWLRSLGFIVGAAEPMGAAGLPFHRFWIEA